MPAARMHAHPDAPPGQDIIIQAARGKAVPSETGSQGLRRIYLILAACLLPIAAAAGDGALTVPRNLAQLTASASDIVRGNVIDARIEKHPELSNLDTVVVTLRLRETLKGTAQGELRFRQYVWDVRNGAAGYRKGQDMLLLLNPPSRYGLTSPVGLDQGRFLVSHDRSGNAVAINGAGNAMLFRGLQSQLARQRTVLTSQSGKLVAMHRDGPIGASELSTLIRELVGAAQ
jgi:hypothetical protein